jgi:hypothetical protein
MRIFPKLIFNSYVNEAPDYQTPEYLAKPYIIAMASTYFNRGPYTVNIPKPDDPVFEWSFFGHF